MLRLVHSHIATEVAKPKKVVKSRYEQQAEEWDNENWNSVMNSDLSNEFSELEKLMPGVTERIRLQLKSK